MLEQTPRPNNETDKMYYILLVDDDQTNQFVTKTRLEKNGFHVTCADNGLEACNAATTVQFDLILMDVSMPIMDGITATRKIRDIPYAKAALPIIGLTAHNQDDVRVNCLNAGMNDYLPKPVTGKELIEKINFWLRLGIVRET